MSDDLKQAIEDRGQPPLLDGVFIDEDGREIHYPIFKGFPGRLHLQPHIAVKKCEDGRLVMTQHGMTLEVLPDSDRSKDDQ